MNELIWSGCVCVCVGGCEVHIFKEVKGVTGRLHRGGDY